MSGLGLRLAASTSRAARVASRSCRIQSRALHKRKELSYPVDEGLGTFLPPQALKMIAVDYQQGLLDRLNDQVRGTALQNKSIVQTIIDAARDPNKILEFNYASEALNNSFFLESLKPPPASAASHEAAIQGRNLYRRIMFEYGSLAQFQSNFSAAVMGMFSSGYVWFVVDQDKRLGVIPTFGTGTLLVRSSQPTPTFLEWQRIVGEPIIPYSELDVHAAPKRATLSDSLPATSSPLSGMETKAPPLDPHTPARSVSYYSRPQGMYDPNADSPLNHTDKDPQKIGDMLYPLLCVSVHEHAWVGAGYGVWGKEEYMKRFWSVVDWEKVNRLYEKVHPSKY
ncbi:manganese and iron superoxide dismutase [Lentinus tigrinus ALCF2SS1-7]|uniref:Manganese and iron superoxide dismutase n=1 Tax=Lentinus tigrinus ALCF2SS1-6 TaxID=1328759 RepID=A0A5C2SFJ6_9APHY|nr:manganese and iron superoxide dismutase [Lentinus tigrinus ALCF2SS1-6]RPD74522.1 manganese and iron superoxide dismutase [Lentinus tigrinus ALCF2SS1-7]